MDESIFTYVNPNITDNPFAQQPQQSLQEVKPRLKQEKKWIVDDEGAEISTKKYVEETGDQFGVYFKKKIYKKFPTKEEAIAYLERQAFARKKFQVYAKSKGWIKYAQMDPILLDGFIAELRGEFLRSMAEKGVEKVNSADTILSFQRSKDLSREIMLDILEKMVQSGDLLKETLEAYKLVIQDPEPPVTAKIKDEKLEGIKKQVVEMFPQLKKYDLILWSGGKEDEYLLQGKVDNELYGNVYRVNIKNKTLELEG